MGFGSKNGWNSEVPHLPDHLLDGHLDVDVAREMGFFKRLTGG